MKGTKIQYCRETLPNFWIINPKNKDYIIVPNRYEINVVPFDSLSLTSKKFCQIIGDKNDHHLLKPKYEVSLPTGGMDSVKVKETNEEETNESLESNIPSTSSGKASNSTTKSDYECDSSAVGKLGVFLEVPKVLNIIKTKFRWTYKVECGRGTNQFYVSGSKSIIKHMDSKGILLDEIATESRNIPRCFTVSRDGHLMYSDTVDRSINIVNNGKVKCIAKVGVWKPQSICSTSSGELLVALKADDVDEAKVVRYCSSKVTQEVQFDSNGQPLYSDPHYIDENKNLDIVVSDFDAKVVVVVDKIGSFRFTYRGNHSDKTSDVFCPRGAC